MTPEFKKDYEDHLSMWGPNCGAPRSVYKGHLDILLRRAVVSFIEEAVRNMAKQVWVAESGGVCEIPDGAVPVYRLKEEMERIRTKPHPLPE